MCEHTIAERFFQDSRSGYGINTLNVARKGICDDKSGIGVPTAYNLPTLIQFVARLLPLTSHCAIADVKATGTIFQLPIFFETRTECVFKFSEREEEVRVHEATLTTNNSDSESGNSQCGESISSSLSSSDDEDSKMFH
jgi:hypothetical protein